MNRNLWHKLANFFEHGDLTPFAVIISIAHYGPVLAAHGENTLVAWMVGTIIDLIHFRTVRRLFQVQGTRRIMGHGAIALMTTAIATMYHLRFYNGDWLLALPIPIGIGILAQHAATKAGQDFAAKWRNRVKLVISIARRAQKRAGDFELSYNRGQAQIKQLQSDCKELQERCNQLQATNKELQTIVKAWQSMNSEVQTLARLNANLITPEQARDLIGVADVRTVQARAERLNGGTK